jgi:hypothetical protein
MGSLFSKPRAPTITAMPQETDTSVQEAARAEAKKLKKRRGQSYMAAEYEAPPDVYKAKLGA